MIRELVIPTSLWEIRLWSNAKSRVLWQILSASLAGLIIRKMNTIHLILLVDFYFELEYGLILKRKVPYKLSLALKASQKFYHALTYF